MVYMHETKRLVADSLVMHFLTKNVIVINKDGMFHKVINKANLRANVSLDVDMLAVEVIVNTANECGVDFDREEIWKFIMEGWDDNNG